MLLRFNLDILAPRLILDRESTLLDEGLVTRWGIKGWDTCTTTPYLLSQSTLGHELYLQFATQILTLEFLVLANVR